MVCPICDAAGRRHFEVHGHWILLCENCGHEYAQLESTEGHVERVYGDHYFRGGAAGYSHYLAESDLLQDRGRYYADVLSRHARPGRVLDVGAAAGFILLGYAAAGWRGTGIEPNDAMARHGREILGLDVRTGTLESFQSPALFQLISMIQVMAHFLRPLDALSAAARFAAPGAFLLIETWNRDSLTRRLFGQNWHEYSPPSVLHWFTPDSLRRAADRAGWEFAGRGRPPKWIHSDHAASLIRHKLDATPLAFAGRLAEKLTPSGISLPYPAEDLFWSLYRLKAPGGKSA